MARPGGGSLGHSKHRKAFGSKYHKSALNRLMLQKMMDDASYSNLAIRESKKTPGFCNIHDLFEYYLEKRR